MKIKGILLATISLIAVNGVYAQGVEHDDMYFNSEDRAKLKAMQTADVAYKSPTAKRLDRFDENENINPTDTYSARNVNPEYTSRSHTQTAQADDQDYFVNNYQYNRTQLNNWNNDFTDWYSSQWYRPNYYGAAINRWNSPYYGYNSWNSPWYDPYWSHNGWSTSFSFHYGRPWNYGWGGNYNYWNRPYYGWDPYGMAYSGYGIGYGGGYWNNYMYPGTIVVVNGGESSNRGVVYGKRPSRSTTIVSDRNNVRSRSNVTNVMRNNENENSGRVSTQNRKQEDYYSRYNRVRTNTNSSYDSRSNTEYNRSRSWDNSSWNSNNSNNNRSSSPSYSPSRSSSGSGTRTNSGTSGGRGRD
jgi:hypothetical protein